MCPSIIEYQANQLIAREDKEAAKILRRSITDVVTKLREVAELRRKPFAELSLMQLSQARNKTARHLAAFYTEITDNPAYYSRGKGEWSISEIMRRMESCLLPEIRLSVYHLHANLGKFRFSGRLSPQEAYERTRPSE